MSASLTPLKTTVALIGVALLAGVAGVWWGQQHASAPQAGAVGAAPAQGAQRKLLFYRNPMGLPDTSPTPKKDPMGMDYIAVYEGEEAAAAPDAAAGPVVTISADKVQKLGVRTEAAALRVLDRAVHAAARIEPDERRSVTIAPKLEGYVDKLLVNATGQYVSKGQALLEVYSPELVTAQREYAIAMQGVQALAQAGPQAQLSMQQLADASLARLRNWDISEEQIKALSQSGEPRRTLTLRAPAAGIVTEKKVVQGQRFMPGDVLYQLTDLSSVWVLADVFESDIAAVRTGARVQVRLHAYPDKRYSGVLTYIYPTLDATTRTVPVRVELANPGGQLKPGMFAQVDIAVGQRSPVVSVPVSAVLDSGKRQWVLVQREPGRFEPREVRLGSRTDSYQEIASGVREGEQVVVSANFLIDAESNLQAAFSALGKSGEGSASTAGVAQPAQATAAPVAGPAAASHAASHQAKGVVVEVDATDASVTLRHEPIPSLKWNAMTMDFKLANTALLTGLKPGVALNFEIVERGKGEWVITRWSPASAASSGTH